MRWMMLACVVLLSGCARSSTPTVKSRPGAGSSRAQTRFAFADMAGTWVGPVMAAGSDSVVANVELTANGDPQDWRLKVTSARDPKRTSTVLGVRAASAADSVVADAGPFPSVTRPGEQVTTHTTYRIEAGKLTGTIRVTYPATGQTVPLRCLLTRKGS